MDLHYHYTHWNVRPGLRRYAAAICRQHVARWNSYRDHPPGYGLDYTSLDFWAPQGRGWPIARASGDKIVKHLLDRTSDHPIRWLIWRGRIWTPAAGWADYNDWQGGHYNHVHVTFL